MKSTLRSAAAASMLLAALGALTVATPAAAQGRSTYVQVAQPLAQIERFVVMGSFDRGGEVRFRVQATPRASAWVDVPGVTHALLAETRPGVYEGRYLLRGRDEPRAFDRAVATVQVAGQKVTAMPETSGDRGHGRMDRDDRAPRISDLTPSQGDRVGDHGRTRIGARIHDRGTGIGTVSLRVDGRDVSTRVRIEGDEVRYAEDLPEGRHHAELTVRDRAGNASREAWSFDVVDRDHGHRHGGDR
jgi:hypothetical protein